MPLHSKDYPSAKWSGGKDELDTHGEGQNLKAIGITAQVFWGDAIIFSYFLINRSPHSKLKEGILDEIWSEKKLKLSHMKVFGCPAYAHVEEIERSKLDQKSQKLIFIGYPQLVKGFLLWDPHF